MEVKVKRKLTELEIAQRNASLWEAAWQLKCKEVSDLSAEVASLRNQVANLKHGKQDFIDEIQEMDAEIKALRTENGNLRAIIRQKTAEAWEREHPTQEEE